MHRISDNIILSHYHSWFDNGTKLKETENSNKSLDNSYDWKSFIEKNVYELEDYIYQNDVNILKFMIMEESCFYVYDNVTLDALVRISNFLQSKNGYVEIFWGSESCRNSMHDKLLSADIREIFNPWLPLYVSGIVWKDVPFNNARPEKLFNSLNKKSRYHRAVMMDQLSKDKLIDNNIITWRAEMAYFPTELEYQWKFWKPVHLTINEVTEDWNMQWSMPESYYLTCIDLITEADVDSPFITEKTWRSIFHSRPFISLAFSGYYKWLTEQGFLLYDEIFDYSFDNFLNVEERAESISSQLKYIQDIYDLMEIKSILLPKIKFNKEHALKLSNSCNIPEYYKEYYNKKLVWWRDVS